MSKNCLFCDDLASVLTDAINVGYNDFLDGCKRPRTFKQLIPKVLSGSKWRDGHERIIMAAYKGGWFNARLQTDEAKKSLGVSTEIIP